MKIRSIPAQYAPFLDAELDRLLVRIERDQAFRADESLLKLADPAIKLDGRRKSSLAIIVGPLDKEGA